MVWGHPPPSGKKASATKHMLLNSPKLIYLEIPIIKKANSDLCLVKYDQDNSRTLSFSLQEAQLKSNNNLIQ